MSKVTIQTDASLAGQLRPYLSEAFPEAMVRILPQDSGSLDSQEALEWVYAGTVAVFTVSGGVQPIWTAIKDFIVFLQDSYRAKRGSNEVALVPTTISYKGREVILDVTSSNPDSALTALVKVLEHDADE